MVILRLSRIVVPTVLFVTISLWLPANSFISIAQRQGIDPGLSGFEDRFRPNLEDTDWQVTTMDFYALSDMEVIYGFGTQGKVGLSRAIVNSPPPQTTLDFDGVFRTKQIPHTVEREPIVIGTYKQTGRSIRIEFSDHIITATIDGNRMQGEAIRKQSGKRAKWVAEKRSNNNDAGRMLPNTHGEVDSQRRPKDFLTQADESTAVDASASTRLKVGTYRASATQYFTLRSGTPITDPVNLIINIESVDSNGNVKATVSSHGKGSIKGRIDDKGVLQLDGSLITRGIFSPTGHRFSLYAVVKDNTLIDGKYVYEVKGGTSTRGVFSIARLGKD